MSSQLGSTVRAGGGSWRTFFVEGGNLLGVTIGGKKNTAIIYVVFFFGWKDGWMHVIDGWMDGLML